MCSSKPYRVRKVSFGLRPLGVGMIPAKSILVLLLSATVLAQESPFHSRETTVAASPSVASELTLTSGTTVADYDVWPTGPDVLILLRDVSGSHVASWHVGSNETVPMLDLPSGFEAQSIAIHPEADRFFVSGKSGAPWIILAVDKSNGKWQQRTIYQSALELRRLLVAPRPFQISYDAQTPEKYRIFFAEREPDGNYSTRSVTEDGQREYQVIGPATSYVPLSGESWGPAQNFTPSALPAAFHPAGHILIWQDAKGCFQQLPYSHWNWGKPAAVAGDPCGGSLTVTPNGAALLHWRRGEPGVTVISDHGRSTAAQAREYQFIATPSSTPDGKGIVGLVARGNQQVLAYVPINVPLADVMNAWMFIENSADEKMLVENSGMLRPTSDDQLYQLYDSESYTWGPGRPARPYLVTTDIFWEIFASAYEGTFIVKERQQAMPAFWAFVTAAQKSLQASAPGSQWAMAFDAVAESGSAAKAIKAEALHIQRAEGVFHSPVFGEQFNFTELKPRGHYTSSPEMEAYFKAVHYLTELAKEKGARDLNSLPADVNAKAMQWIAAYQGFIAPSRAPLVWSQESFHPPAYALHPLDTRQIFPLSWGFDNEVLLSTVYHEHWPEDEQIIGRDGKGRVLPSGLDLAAALGSGYSQSLLKTDLAEYPQLGPVLGALQARRPKDSAHQNVYDAWIDALAVQWADNVQFPGVTDDSLWKAKRLQTGLASWATLRHATVLVNERSSAEAGEGGFETLITQPPRGYVEPDPNTFRAIASLFDDMERVVAGSANLEGYMPINEDENAQSEPLRNGIVHRLRMSAENARLFASIAEKELRSEELSGSDYEQILYVGAVAEHDLLVYKSLANKDLALSTPEPMMKVAEVAGGGKVPLLEVAVGLPLEWDQIVPYFGRREMVKGSVYSYYEFSSPEPLNDREWAQQIPPLRESAKQQGSSPKLHAKVPSWVQPFISTEQLSCPAEAPF
jgi:hypothetical protein